MKVYLSKPQSRAFRSTAKSVGVVAGYGCVHPATKIYTEFGLIPISEIRGPVRVLSWNERDKRFQLSLSGGSFPKGRDCLHQVSTEQGESVTTLHHRIFSFSGIYQSISSFSSGDVVPSFSSLSLTTEELGLLLSSLSVQSYNQKDVNSMVSYASEARQYGQRFLKGGDDDRELVPSSNDAQELYQSCGYSSFSRKDVLKGLKRGCNHLNQFFSPLCKNRLNGQKQSPFSFVEGQISKPLLGRISVCLHKAKIFLLRLKSRYSVGPHSFDVDSFLKSPLIENKILQVMGVEENVYYDMQVLSTNNYVCESGIIHHNSGKTKVALEKAMNLLHEFPGVPVAYGAPTYDLIKSIWYPAIEELCDQQGIQYDINRGNHIVTFPGLGKMICRSLSNPGKIVGWECGSAILDEFDVLPSETAKEGWLKMKARCRFKYPKFKRKRDRERFGRKVHPNQMFAVSTPEGFKAFYEYFEESPLPGSQLIRMSTHSNQTNLPDDYIDELMSQYPPQLIKAYIMGVFVNLTQGSVYPNFSRELNYTDREIVKGDELHIGMDFNVTKMAATISVIDYVPENIEIQDEWGIPQIKTIMQERPKIVDELYKLHDTPGMINAIKERFKPKHYAINVYPDASGKSRKSVDASKSDISLLRDAGFNVIVNERNPYIKDRVLSTNGMFENGKGERKLCINIKKCPKTTKCIEQQVYDDNGIPEKKRDIDHLPDTVGYFINQRYGISKPSSQIISMY